LEKTITLEKKISLIFLSLVQIETLNERGIYHDLLREFVKNGHEVTIVCPVERRTKLPTRILYEEGVTILQVRTLNIQKTSILEKGIATITLIHFLKRAINKYFNDRIFDLILYATPPITLTNLVSWLKHKHNAKTYLLLKDIFPQNAIDLKILKKESFLYRYFINKEKLLYKLSDKIGCMSPANQTYILKHNPELSGTVEVNPNSLDLNRINRKRKERSEVENKLGLPSDAIVFLYGGNLGKPQGIDFLTQIISEANSNNKNAFFLIIGDGTEYSKLFNWFTDNKPTNAKLIKHLPKSDFDEIAACCDVGIILLRKEFTIPNFPSRLLTYLENKMPVLAITDNVSDIGPIAENNNFGKWCLFGNNEEVTKEISFFIDNEELRKQMGINGFEFMLKEYDTKISHNKIMRLLDE
jgi:glycosyltransferase involved in cell wall biosynthesis